MIERIGILFTVLCAATSFGQGLISFQNRVTTTIPAVDAPIRHCNGSLLSGTDSLYRAALLGGPTNATPATSGSAGTLQMLASPSSGATWVTFRTGAAVGYIAVGTDHIRDSGLPYGSTGMFQVVVWHGSQTTWQEAFNAWKTGQQPLAGWSNPLILAVTKDPSDTVPVLIGLNSFLVGIDIGLSSASVYPSSQTGSIGSSVTFTGSVGSLYPAFISRQWQVNGANLPGATSHNLVISNITVAHQGAYSFIASSTCRTVTSAPAMLTVKHAHLTAQSSDAGAFRMMLTGTPGVTFQLQGTTNFSNWTSLGIFTNQVGSLQITDSIAPGSLLRFYRAVLQ